MASFSESALPRTTDLKLKPIDKLVLKSSIFAFFLTFTSLLFIAWWSHNSATGSQLLSDIQPAIYELIVIVLATTLSIVSLAILFMRQVVNRYIESGIQQLNTAINNIEHGDLSEIDLDKATESGFSSLFRSLESMRKHIEINQKSMYQLAYFDKLTGLPNRASLYHELKILISSAKRKKQSFSVIFMDIDEFKVINDTFGHEIGDQLLSAISQRIQSVLRGSDFIVRDKLNNSESNNLIAQLAGDEFTLLIHEVEGPNSVSKVAQRILDSLNQVFILNDQEIEIGASIGISIYPQDGEDVDTLLRNADYAMFEAKNNGKNCFAFFTKEMNAIAFQRLSMEKNIRNALENNEFLLFFHPRIDLQQETVIGFEALIRWQSPEMGLISPNQFLPIAEETMLICDIGYWVFDNVCQYIKACIAAGHPDIRVSINLSTMQIYRGDTYNMLKALMALHNIPGKNIEIEVDESGLLKDESTAIELLEKLKELDITIALDDFGTGYSSIRFLQNLPLDVLKVDRSYVVDVEGNPTAKQLLKSIIEIANNLNLETVASGIEHREQIDFAKSIQCDYVQGYFYSKPLPSDDALGFLEQWNKK